MPLVFAVVVCSTVLVGYFDLLPRSLLGGRDSALVRGVPYEPAAPYKVCRAKFESVKVFWRVVATVEEL
jgi:hypothetical protein